MLILFLFSSGSHQHSSHNHCGLVPADSSLGHSIALGSVPRSYCPVLICQGLRSKMRKALSVLPKSGSISITLTMITVKATGQKNRVWGKMHNTEQAEILL